MTEEFENPIEKSEREAKLIPLTHVPVINNIKNYIYIREEWAKPATTFDCHWKTIDIWVGRKHPVFCSYLDVTTLF